MDKQPPQIGVGQPDGLCFMLYQLRDDLGELIYGMETGTSTRRQVVAAAKNHLTWVLQELSDESESE